MKHDTTKPQKTAVRAAIHPVLDAKEKLAAWDAEDKGHRDALDRLERAAAALPSKPPLEMTVDELMGRVAVRERIALLRPWIGSHAGGRDVRPLFTAAKKLVDLAAGIGHPGIEYDANVIGQDVTCMMRDNAAEQLAEFALDFAERMLATRLPVRPAAWTFMLEPYHIQYLRDHATPEPE